MNRADLEALEDMGLGDRPGALANRWAWVLTRAGLAGYAARQTRCRSGAAPPRVRWSALMAEIVLDQVNKVYPGGVKGVNELNLEIKDGEFMVLVGPSGCGKTTALRSHRRPGGDQLGTITIGGRVVNFEGE